MQCIMHQGKQVAWSNAAAQPLEAPFTAVETSERQLEFECNDYT
jgi:hypothetical protein